MIGDLWNRLNNDQTSKNQMRQKTTSRPFILSPRSLVFLFNFYLFYFSFSILSSLFFRILLIYFILPIRRVHPSPHLILTSSSSFTLSNLSPILLILLIILISSSPSSRCPHFLHLSLVLHLSCPKVQFVLQEMRVDEQTMHYIILYVSNPATFPGVKCYLLIDKYPKTRIVLGA